MKPNYTDITILLDRSGSMISIQDATIKGFNAFLEAQRKAPGEATISLVQFSSHIDTVYSGIDIKSAKRLNYETFTPGGGTALLDAIAMTIEKAGDRYRSLPEDQRPSKVLFAIITDGEENASRFFTKDEVFAAIRRQQIDYSWQFSFLGANQDAITVANGLGIRSNASMTYAHNEKGAKAAFTSMSNQTTMFRSAVLGAEFHYKNSDRDAQIDATVKP